MRPRVRIAVAAVMFLLIHRLIKKKNRKSKRFWVKKLYQNRSEYGNRLYADLIFDGEEHNFTRMPESEFEILYSLVNAKISRSDTNFRKAITARERLLITLRFLATGDSYTSLQYLFRVSKQRISVIVPDVCDAIIEQLKDYVKVCIMKHIYIIRHCFNRCFFTYCYVYCYSQIFVIIHIYSHIANYNLYLYI